MTIEIKAESAQTSSVGLSSWLDGVKVFINGREVPLDKPFFLQRGVENRLKLEVASSLNGTMISLNNASDQDLVIADPDFGIWEEVVNNIVEWVLSQDTSQSGILDLVCLIREEATILELQGLVMSRNLSEEMQLHLNGSPIPANPTVLSRKSFELSLVDRNGMNLPISLKYVSGTGITKDKFSVSPPFDQNAKLTVWSLTANIDNDATAKFAFHPDVSEMIPIETTLTVKAVVPKTFFQGKEVLSGGSVDAAIGFPHALTLDAANTGFENTKVKVEVVGGQLFGDVEPKSFTPMNPMANFIFTPKNVGDAELQLKITFENSPALNVIIKVNSTKAVPEIIDIKARDRFVANQICYFDVKVAAKNHATVLLEGVEVGADVLGIPILHSYTDKDGMGFIYVQLAAGDYVLKAFTAWKDEEKQWHMDIPFTVHSA